MGSQDITMIDSWDGINNDVYDEDCFDYILNTLDFPMESLEDDGLAEYWDAKFQCLGPIPSQILRESPPVGINYGSSDILPNSFVQNGRTSQLKQQPTFVKEVSGTKITIDSSEGNESGVFQAPSPVSVFESSSPSSAKKGISVGAKINIPVRTRSKRLRRPTFNPWLVMTFVSSSNKISHLERTKQKKKKKLSQLSSGAMEKKDTSLERPNIAAKKCDHCEITKTPQWREGPMGPKTLCNACGVRYRSGRLFPEYRPAASPTFVPSLHSNSHKKVIEMRNKAIIEEKAGMAEMDSPVSPPPEFIPTGSYLFDHM